MAHPMAGEAKASQKRRLGRLGASAGKGWGSSQMYKKSSYPGTHAGSNTPFTIGGNKGKKRADRRANGGVVGKLASGGGAGKKKKGHHTTNIVIAAPGGGGGHALGGRGGMPVAAAPRPPVIAPRPGIPLRPPIAAGPPPGAGLGAAMPARPPMPVVGGPPPGAGGPPLPGMKHGGVVKKAKGGTIGGKAGRYAGFPHSPTSDAGSKLSAHRNGGRVGRRARGGAAGMDSGSNDDDKEKRKEPQGAITGDDTLDPGRSNQALSALGTPSAGPPIAGATDPNAPPTPPPPAPPASLSDRNGGIVGGGVKKRQMGGGAQQQQTGGGLFGMTPPGRAPIPAQQGPATLSGRPARPAQPLTVPMPTNVAAYRTRPAPGTMVGFKKGGKVPKAPKEHGDEAEDRKLFNKMMKERGRGKKGR